MTVRHPNTSVLRAALFPGLIAACLGATVLAGWLWDIAALRSALPFGIPMRANAALGMLLSGIALATLSSRNPGWPPRAFAAIAGAMVAALGALTLSQDLFGRDFGIDQWLIPDSTRTSRFTIPGRMSPPAAFCLLLAGSALFAAARPIRSRPYLPLLLALATMLILIGGIALFGVATQQLLDVRFLSYSRIAAYTALGFVLLGGGLMALARRDGGVKWSLGAVATGGFVAGLLAMVVTAAVSYQFTSAMRGDAVEVGRTLEVVKEIEKLSAKLGEFTISAGRYIITRDERTLDGREGTKRLIEAGLSRLRELIRLPAPRVALEQIAQIHQKRVAMSDGIIAGFRARLRAGRPPSAGEPSPLGEEYPALGRDIERLVDLMLAEEYAALDRRQKRASKTAAKTFLLLPLGLFFGMLLLSLGLFSLNSGESEKLRAKRALETNGKRLAVLHEIDQAIIAGKSPAQIAEAALPRLRDLLALPRVVVNIFDLERNEAEWLVATGRNRLHVGPGIRYSMELMGDLDGLRRGEPQRIEVDALKQRAEAQALLASGVRWYMVVPMIVGGELVGGLSFGGPAQEFLPDQMQIAKEVAAQLAIAISQSRLAERARQADARSRLIIESVPLGITMTSGDGTILSANPALVRMLGYASEDEALRSLGDASAAYAESDTRAEYQRRLRNDGAVRGYEADLLRKDGSRFTATFDGTFVPDPKGQDALLVTIVDDISLKKEQGRRIARLSRVKAMQSSINSAVVRIHERPALLDEVCRIAVDQGGIRAAWVGWHDVESRLLRPVASSGVFDGFLEMVSLSTDLPPDKVESPAVRALQSGKPHVNNDIQASAGLVFAAQAATRGYLAMMQLPLKVDGHPQGVLVLYAPEAGFFDDEETKLLEELAADVSFALDSLQKSERLNYLAFYDPLTGLPNRSLFHDRLSHSLNSRGGDARLIAVVLLDLERFRRVNETLGRQSGDELLREAGARLQKAHDSVARIGADVYGLVLRGARAAAEVNRNLESILEACFTQTVQLHGDDFRISCRAGVALHPEDGADADVLLRNAEAALRRSKNSGERVVFYAAEMNAQVAEALSTENKLRRAVEGREFVLHYQPKVALNDGRIVGAEALIRWQDPDKGLVPPGRFIPILEETGLIIEVGRWALEQTFVDLYAWSRKGLQPLRVAVNVSSMQLQRRDFVDTVIEEIANGGDRPDWLELEITESLVMRNVEDSTRKLSILRGMGVTVAIDDFGTGYSSLSYLSRLPVDALKIDRSFVQGVVSGGDSQTLVSTIVTLAHGLSLKVVAEGVETEAQAEKLRRYSCDQAQGYLYSKAVPAADFERLLLLPGARLPAAG